jgi:hypothetical protein
VERLLLELVQVVEQRLQQRRRLLLQKPQLLL